MSPIIAAVLAACSDDPTAVEALPSGSPPADDTAIGDTGGADTADTGDVGAPGNRHEAGPYASGVIAVDIYEDVMTELGRLAAGDSAVLDISAYWCGPCQSWKPYYEYLAWFDNGQHPWITAEDQEGMEEVSYDIWNNWTVGGAEDPTLMESCWSTQAYYPQILIVSALGGGEYTAHEVYGRGAIPDLFREAASGEADVYPDPVTIRDEDGTERESYLIFNDDRATNELHQVEDGVHIYDE